MFNVPTIHITEKEVGVFGPPREKVWPDKKWIKHVACPFARFHVFSYGLSRDGVVVRCSEPDCIVNAPKDVIFGKQNET